MTLHSLCLYGSIGISATLLAGGTSLPCAYLFDPEKSQIVFMMSFMASTGIIEGIVLLTNLFIPVKENILLAFNIVLAISAVWFFISDRGKGISETGYYLIVVPSPLQASGAAAAAPLAFLRVKTFHDISATFHYIGVASLALFC